MRYLSYLTMDAQSEAQSTSEPAPHPNLHPTSSPKISRAKPELHLLPHPLIRTTLELQQLSLRQRRLAPQCRTQRFPQTYNRRPPASIPNGLHIHRPIHIPAPPPTTLLNLPHPPRARLPRRRSPPPPHHLPLPPPALRAEVPPPQTLPTPHVRQAAHQSAHPGRGAHTGQVRA